MTDRSPNSLLPENAQAVIEAIDIDGINSRLIELARINGQMLQPTEGHPQLHYATYRLALSESDVQARQEVVGPWMERIGMEVEQYPLATIGTLKGTGDGEPLILVSHVDTVPGGDMYDGTYGVISALEVVDSMRRTSFKPSCDVIVMALTGEESTVFGSALFGSKALSKGLSDDELAATDEDGRTLGEALGDAVEAAKEPLFGEGRPYPLPFAAIELHVEQASSLEQQQIQIGLVETIAAPERYKAFIGTTELEPDEAEYTYQAFAALKVAGKADHSGATPMSPSVRADGLLATAKFLEDLTHNGSFNEGFFAIGDIEIDRGSMNKIPGETTTYLRIGSNDREQFLDIYNALESAIDQQNTAFETSDTGFDAEPFSLTQLGPNEDLRFYEPAEMLKRQWAAFDVINHVNDTAVRLAEAGVAATVATYKALPGGRIQLEIDLRGTVLVTRDAAAEEIKRHAGNTLYEPVELGEPLAGSGEPVVMDGRMIKLAQQVLKEVGISNVTMPCKAGHDIQNLGRAGIPSVLMLIQSNNGGKAHNPEAYTSDDNLLVGAQALAALVTTITSQAA